MRAHDKNIYSYQSILYSPEILFNIGKIINALDKNIDYHYYIDKWKNNNRMKRYILEFTISFNYLDFNIKHTNENYYIDNE